MLLPERSAGCRQRASSYSQGDQDGIRGAHNLQFVSVWLSSRASKSENRSALLSRYCRSLTALTATVPSWPLPWRSVFQCAPPSIPTPTASSATAAVITMGRRNQARSEEHTSELQSLRHL